MWRLPTGIKKTARSYEETKGEDPFGFYSDITSDAHSVIAEDI
jgi:hypothetical protein